MTKLADLLERLSYFYVAIADDLCRSRGFWYGFYSAVSGALFRPSMILQGAERYDDAYGVDRFSNSMKWLGVWQRTKWDRPIDGRRRLLAWSRNEDSMLTA